MQALKIIFFGTPEFAACSLRAIAKTKHEILAVITAPDKPSGRGLKMQESDVKKAALELGLTIWQPTNLKDPEFQKSLKALHADLGIVIAFRMLPEAVWSAPRLGTFNLHASLLPQYRGAAPIQHAIINGEKFTGITTFFLKHEIDTGNILLQERVEIDANDNAGTLHDKLMFKGSDLVLQTLDQIASGQWQEIPQAGSENLKTAPKLNREFCRLDHGLSKADMHNKIRGLSPYPGAWLSTNYGEIKILESDLHTAYQGLSDFEAGIDGVFVKCADGYIEVRVLQPAGKPRMKAIDFVNGLVNRKG